MLKKARKKKFESQDIKALNQRLVIKLSNLGNIDTVHYGIKKHNLSSYQSLTN